MKVNESRQRIPWLGVIFPVEGSFRGELQRRFHYRTRTQSRSILSFNNATRVNRSAFVVRGRVSGGGNRISAGCIAAREPTTKCSAAKCCGQLPLPRHGPSCGSLRSARRRGPDTILHDAIFTHPHHCLKGVGRLAAECQLRPKPRNTSSGSEVRIEIEFPLFDPEAMQRIQ